MLELSINLDTILYLALEETKQMMQLGIDISEPCIVTSLEWYANKYPEITDRCNHALIELVGKQAVMHPEWVVLDSKISSHSF